PTLRYCDEGCSGMFVSTSHGKSQRESAWHSRPGRLRFQLFCGFWPVFPQQARQAAVGEQLASRLAMRTIVRLVAGIANSLYFGPAARAWLPVLAMHGHSFTKRRHLFRELAACLFAQFLHPFE